MEVSVYFFVILKENLILSGKWQSCGFHATSSGWWGALGRVDERHSGSAQRFSRLCGNGGTVWLGVI
jgi:hypothetical protein